MTRKPSLSLADDLIGAVGEARVRQDPSSSAVLHARPGDTSEILHILEIARSHGVPLLPRTPGLDVSEVTMPPEGGVVLDLLTVDRVLEINHTHRYALVEPGVTWRALEKRLLDDGAYLALPVTAPAEGIGPFATCLVDGAEGSGLTLGHSDRFLLGLEAVLPTGELVRTAPGISAGEWWGRGPHPNLSGLFSRWRGATGIVTRLAVSLTPRPRYIRRLLLPASDWRAAVAASIRLARSGLFDETHVVHWNLPRMLLGAAPTLRPHDGEPEAWLAVDFRADSLPELEYKRVHLAQALSRATRRGGGFDDPISLPSMSRVSPSMAALQDLPVCMPSLPGDMSRAAGCMMMGFHGPVRGLVDGARDVEAVCAEDGIPAVILTRPVPEGQHGVLHLLVFPPHNASKPPVFLREAAEKVVARLLPAGFIPQRYPREFEQEMSSTVGTGSRDLARRLAEMLDPDGVLDPARWGLLPPV